MEQINTIDKISAVYRNTAEEARQELNKVQQKIYRIGSLRLLLFVAGVVGIIYFWSESWGRCMLRRHRKKTYRNPERRVPAR